jgi:molybdopterin-guanine dinucleotide biosynthesis protein MobB
VRAPSTRDLAGNLPPVVCVVGYKDTGKTGVAVRLIAELRVRGHRVGAVKHGHGFQLDTPGTDSWRLRHEGGADPVLLTGPEGFALMGHWEPEEEPALEKLIPACFPHAGIVVVEGFKSERFPKLEVHRRDAHPELIYRPGSTGAETFLGVVTDTPELVLPIPCFPLDAPDTPARLADLVERLVMGTPRADERPAPSSQAL